jgi:hypothetical protein
MELVYLNRNVGNFREDRTFITYREEKHIFRIFKGLGMSYGLLKKLQNMRCKKIILILHKGESEEKLEAEPIDFLTYGHIYFDKLDSQRVLPLDFLRNRKLEG